MASNKAALKRLASTATEQTIRGLVQQLQGGLAAERASAAKALGAIAAAGITTLQASVG